MAKNQKRAFLVLMDYTETEQDMFTPTGVGCTIDNELYELGVNNSISSHDPTVVVELNTAKIGELLASTEGLEVASNDAKEFSFVDEVDSWEELAQYVSPTHNLKVDVEGCNGWITAKDGDWKFYLSTHSFYGSQFEASSKILQDCGFPVKLANWDGYEFKQRYAQRMGEGINE